MRPMIVLYIARTLQIEDVFDISGIPVICRFRQYGIWERYAELYPEKDLIYTIGVSDYTKDWFYAQVTR